MEGVYAAMKAALVPVNVNYRYREEELRYLLDNADAEIVVVHEEFVPLLATVVGAAAAAARRAGRRRRRRRRRPAACRNAESTKRSPSSDRPAPRGARARADDHLFLYTGGTTGMPKGVMWRQADLYLRLAGGGLDAAAGDARRAARSRRQSADAACAR